MLVFMSLGIHLWTVVQTRFFFSISNSRGELKNVVLKYRKELNIIRVSYIIGCVHPNKNISDFWSLQIQA